MFKPGDRVVCKYVDNSEYITRYFILNEIYTITKVSKVVVYVGELAFKKVWAKEHYNFDDYFITLKEYRKQKLDKICLNQEIE